MQANDQFLSVIEKLISKVKPVETLVEFAARKIVPTVSAGAASCPTPVCQQDLWGGVCNCKPPNQYQGMCGTNNVQYRWYTYLYRSSPGAPCGSCSRTICMFYGCC